MMQRASPSPCGKCAAKYMRRNKKIMRYGNDKTENEIIESVIGFEPLYESMMKCKKGVLWKNQPAHYYLNGIEETIKLSDQLRNGTYKPRKTRKVKIAYPKPREAVANAFRDRVYQRSLNDNVLYPAMTRSFIDDNMACQKGRGPDVAMDRLDEFLRQMFRKYGLNFWILQGDIHGYYPNMSHSKTESRFHRKVTRAIYGMTTNVLRGQYEGSTGYNPGSQMVQIAGVSYLDPFDHFMKEQLHVTQYERYMDDFVDMNASKEVLEDHLKKIKCYMDAEECELHPKKTRIYHVTEGVTFLGFKHRLTESGKVIRTIDPDNVKHERLKLRRQVALVAKGEMKKSEVEDGYKCWKAHVKRGNSTKVLERTDKYLKNLWKEYGL